MTAGLAGVWFGCGWVVGGWLDIKVAFVALLYFALGLHACLLIYIRFSEDGLLGALCLGIYSTWPSYLNEGHDSAALAQVGSGWAGLGRITLLLETGAGWAGLIRLLYMFLCRERLIVLVCLYCTVNISRLRRRYSFILSTFL